MRTTLKLEDETYQELLDITGESSVPKAIKRAVDAFIRREKLERLRALRGKVDILENDEIERAELEALNVSG